MKEIKECCKAQIKEIDISNLKFNPNPLRGKMEDLKKSVYPIKILMRSIGTNGYFKSKPLLVIKDFSINKISSKYTVIDGNMRLQAVRVLSNPDLIVEDYFRSLKRIYNEAGYKPKKIPCIIYENPFEIYKEIGYDHIEGISTWYQIDKAEYYQLMLDTVYLGLEKKEAIKNLSSRVGSSPTYITNLITSLKLYKSVIRYFNNTNVLKDSKPLDSIFFDLTDSLYYEKVKEYLNIDMNAENPLESVTNSNVREFLHHLYDSNYSKSFFKALMSNDVI